MAVKTYEEVVREDAPEVLLRFTETSGVTAADATRFGRDFTHSGSPTLDQTGPVNKAVSYDGTDDQTTYSVNMPITGYPFTIEGWMQTPGTTSSSTTYCTIALADSSQTNVLMVVQLLADGSNNLQCRAYASNTTSQISSGSLPNALKGEWVYVVGVFRSATDREVYANAVGMGPETTSVSFPSGLDTFGVGVHPDSTPNHDEGLIAEPAFYNYELSESRMRVHHAVGRGYTDTDSYGYAVLTEAPNLYATLGDASGNAVDASGNERDLTAAGSPTYGASGPLSEAGGDDAVTFDGTDDAFALAGDDLGITAYPVVVQGYLKAPASLSNSTSYCRVMFGDDGTEDNYFGIDLTTDGSGNLQARGLLETGGTADHITGTPVLNADQFYHVTFRCVSATERYLEINGVKTDSATTSRAFGSNIDDVVIGRDLAASANFYAGTIGQVAIYGRDIGGSAVRNQYAKAKQYLGDDFRTTSLAKCPFVYWRQGESSGSTAADETEFGNDGTIAGGVTLGEDGGVVDDADTAMLFDGVDGQITAPITVAEYPVTLEALVKLPSTIGASNSYIRVGLTDASGTMKMVAGLKTDSNTKLRAFAEEVGTSTGTINNDCGGKVTNYHHLIVEFISDTSRKIWLNGVELEEETTSVSLSLANLDTVCVGVEDLGTDAWYEGYCDEFLLYQRQLSDAEKRDQYMAGLGYLGEAISDDGEAAYLQTVLGDAPSLFWPLNETSGTDALDASRWGRDGTYSGGFTLDQDGPISVMKSANFDGVDGMASYSDANDMPIKAYPYTMEFWVKSPDTLALSTLYAFLSIADSAGSNNYIFICPQTDASSNVYARGNHRTGGVTNTIQQNSGTGVSAQNSKFVHIVLVGRSATDRELYANCRSVATDTGSASFPSSLDKVSVGANLDSGQTFGEGDSGYAAFYNYALTESQIRKRFMAGRAIFEADNPYLYEVGQLVPAAHYRLNEDSGTTAADLLGLRDLTIAGSPTLGAAGPLYNKDDDGAITLDGTDDEATLAGDNLQISAYPIAVSGWIASPASITDGVNYGYSTFGDDTVSDNQLSILLRGNASGTVYPWYFFNSGGTSDHFTPSSPSLETAVFHHIVFVARSSTDRELFVNGVSIGSDATSHGFPSNMDDIILGRSIVSGPTFVPGTIAEFSILTSDVSDSEALALYLSAFEALALVINVYQESMADTVSVDDQVALAFFNSMVDTIEVSDEVKLTWLKSLSDSVGLADTISAVMTFVNAVSDSVSVADSVNNILKAIASIEDTVEASEVINARGVFIRSMSDSIETSITINVSGVEYVGLVLNTTNMAISTYAGWDFNSFAQIGDSYIGAGRAGVYELGGDDDDGTNIEWEIDFGSIDFGNSQDKRLPEIFYACRSDGTILFKVTHVKDDGAKVENWYQATRTSDALTERRVKLKKGVKSQYYRVEVMGKDGSSVDLEKIELIPMVLMRKL